MRSATLGLDLPRQAKRRVYLQYMYAITFLVCRNMYIENVWT